MSLAGLASRLDRLAKAPQDGTRAAARAVVQSAKREGEAAGPVHLGKRKRPVRLTAVARFRGSGAVTVWGRPTGPWVWVTAGTHPHTIPKAKRGRGGKARTTRYLKSPAYPHPIGRPVIHPGGTGRGAWLRVRRAARHDVPAAYVKAVRKAVR